MTATPFLSRPLRAYAAFAKGALWLLLAVWIALGLAWGALHVWIVPRIGEWRPWLETEAGRVLGIPVRIGAVSAQSEGLMPSFELREVRLLDAQGRDALRLPRVLASLSPRSLARLGFEQLYIDQPELDIRRDPQGRIHIAGLDVSRPDTSDGGVADWFFSQSEFVIRGGTVRWTDELRNAPTLALSDVSFVTRNQTRRHALRLDATPPADWGSRFTLMGQFRQPLLSGRAGRWQDWEGQLHANFDHVDLAALRRQVHLGVSVAQGRGALRAWADVARGELVGATADVVLADVDMTLGDQLAPLALQSVSGRLGGKRLAGGVQFQTQDLQFTTRDGLRWPGGNVQVSWVDEQGTLPAQGELRADRLDLAALAEIATRLPLAEDARKALAEFAPRGLVETVQAKWQGPLSAPRTYEAHGRATGLAATAARGLPGLSGASIDFDLTQAGGKARVGLQQGRVVLPSLFEEPELAFDTASADLAWQVAGEQLSLNVNNLRFSHADVQGDASLTWRTGDPAKTPGATRLPGVLDLQGSLSRANGARLWRYLPLGLPQDTRAYVRRAVSEGTITSAKFRVKGDLHQFPFADGRGGEFFVSAQFRDTTYAYVPPSPSRPGPAWPALTQMAGELVFERGGMQVKNASGRIAGYPGLQFKADARIRDLGHTVVELTGQIRGPLGDALGVVQNSPLATLSRQSLARTKGGGATEVKLAFKLPLADLDQSTVQGSVALSGNELQITPDSPVLTRVRGNVAFSEKGFALNGVQARSLGGDVRIDGGLRPGPTPAAEPVLAIRAQGNATAEGLRAARELGFVSRLAREATGGASYAVTVGLRRGVPEVVITSNLLGLALNLPAPLAKPADQALPLRYENTLARESVAPTAPLRDQVLLEMGPRGSVQYIRDVSGPEPRVLRGAIALGLAPGEAAQLPEQGVSANINLVQADADVWQSLLDRVFAAPASQALPAPGAASPTPRATAASNASLAYLPSTLALRARELRADKRSFKNVVVGGARDGLTWRASVDADELGGYVEYRQPSGNASGRLYARLARLSLAASDTGDVEALLDEQPTGIPALDIVVDDFELRGRKLGRLEIDAVNRVATGSGGATREWRLNKLNMTVPEGQLSASGNWAALTSASAAQAAPARSATRAPERRRTVMSFRLDVSDAGGLLGRLGMRDVLRRGHGRMEGQVAWVGSPLALDYPSLSGSFNVNMEEGQFLKADPGLAKLLGVLSLQALPRRLTLDFRDVFSDGFAYDFVRGDIAIQQGMASTNNLQMRGVNAAVLMEGRADIARETQDLRVVVVPEINAGTASLVASVINPAVGLGTFLAQLVLRQPLIRANTQEFVIDGTWGDPRVTRVARETARTPAAGAAN